MYLSPRIDESLTQKINTEEEYERSDDHDWNVSNYDWPSDKYSESSECKHDTSNATIPATAHEENSIGVNQVVL